MPQTSPHHTHAMLGEDTIAINILIKLNINLKVKHYYKNVYSYGLQCESDEENPHYIFKALSFNHLAEALNKYGYWFKMTEVQVTI